MTALVRDDADAVAARGAIPVVVDLDDRPAVAGVFRAADAAIHTASAGDSTSADLDAALVDAAISEPVPYETTELLSDGAGRG